MVIGHYLMFKDGVFEFDLADDTFRACKLINISWPFLVSGFDSCDLHLRQN